MITSKQRARLKGLANTIDTLFQVGKEGISPALIVQVEDALEARELIKLRCLSNSGEEPKAVSEEIAKQTRAEVVQVIGSRFVLYRENKKLPNKIRIDG